MLVYHNTSPPDGGPSMDVLLAHPNDPRRSNYSSKVKEWVKSFLVQQAEMPAWAYSKSHVFVTLLEEVPEVVMV